MLLALDTATRQISLALHDGETLIAELTWPSDNQHTVQLIPAVQRLLEQCGLTPLALSAFAVAVGPGSFTGLRIGVAAAKAMAAARNAPLVGVNTLDISASGHPGASQNALVAAAAAGRGRVVVRSYTWRKNEWRPRSDMRLTDWAGLVASLDGAATITGDIDAAGLAALKQAQAAGVPLTIAPAGYRLRRAGILAQLAWDQLAEKVPPGTFDPSRIVPIYVKSDSA
ncbi:MAG: tRNA (adenosine(37)-N6)-threonylcarbamoyltransferase complex dimerization subunit type 1 TsaB [Chloroflexi bacterium]|nr:tRNA (adenosine(37)-N6)-threonylcarbamoyltransferase complex dimerization subunit type 1 TsaB [Chloroflexota bacterium]